MKYKNIIKNIKNQIFTTSFILSMKEAKESVLLPLFCETKKIIIIFTLCILGVSSYSVTTLDAVEIDSDADTTSESTENIFTTYDKDGNLTIYDVTALEEKTAYENATKWDELLALGSVGGTSDIEYGVVNFKTKSSSSTNTTYTIIASGKTGYTNGYYGADAAFLGFDSSGNVLFMQSGVIGSVAASEVEILDYTDSSSVKSVNFYRVEDGRIYHYGTNDISSSYYWLVNDIGPQQSYMESNKVYYSYDGHYFYESYKTMINDYKAGVYTNSINADSPYYNYYQYLSHRSESTFTAEQFDAYLESKTSLTTSKMIDTGEYFLEYQDIYGVNATLIYGVAINESYYGNSTIAQDKNNLFGHGATDSNPYYGANGYDSVVDSILYHAKVFISEGYLDPCDGYNTSNKGYSSSYCLTGRYYGASLGDKNSGVNVKYASDPYWGEKAARIGWELEKFTETTEVEKEYTIGIKSGEYLLNVRSSASTSGTVLYQMIKNADVPVIILEEVEGESVNGSTVWYKIQSDATINSSTGLLLQDNGEYNFDTNVGYVHSSYITIVSNEDALDSSGSSSSGSGSSDSSSGSSGSSGSNSGSSDSGGSSSSTILYGDVSSDGKVSAADYLMIKDYIMGTLTLTTTQKTPADVNKDSKVSAADYLMIKDYIMGKISLE